MELILLNSTTQLEEIISLCKSDSGVCGKKLREAHTEAGRLLGAEISKNNGWESVAVIIMMRAGLPFGLGIADELEANKKVRIFFSTKEQVIPLNFKIDEFDKILIVDAVIRTGKGMLELAEKLGAPDKIVFATNVIDESGIDNFKGKTVYAVRSSKHSFIGTKQKTIERGKGPDTGDRLFCSDF